MKINLLKSIQCTPLILALFVCALDLLVDLPPWLMDARDQVCYFYTDRGHAAVDRAVRERGMTRNRFIAEILRRVARAKSDEEISRRIEKALSDPRLTREQRETASDYRRIQPRRGTEW